MNQFMKVFILFTRLTSVLLKVPWASLLTC